MALPVCLGRGPAAGLPAPPPFPKLELPVAQRQCMRACVLLQQWVAVWHCKGKEPLEGRLHERGKEKD